MYTNTAFFNHQETDLVDLSRPLRINSCGTYRLVSKPSMATVRPSGREDYQLIYIAAGQAHFTFGSEEKLLSAGHMVLYLPGQPQYYTYYLKDAPEVYWVHFTGAAAAALTASLQQLADLKNTEAPYFASGILPEYQSLYLYMIRELQVARPGYEELLPLLFQQLLVLVKRHLAEGSLKQYRLRSEIEQAVHYFNENLASPIEIEAYAQSQHMSCCWFIRSFKQQMGMPPLQYLISVRMNRAMELLEGTEYTVTEIGSMVGYENPLYFSKLFKKQTGKSPTEFRKAIWE